MNVVITFSRGRRLTSEKDKSLAVVCWATTAILGCFLCFLQLGAMISLMAARTGFRLVAPFALVAALLAGIWLTHKERLSQRLRWVPIALAVGLVALSMALSAFYYDLSWDGEWYHQTGIIHIASDWNPLTDPMHEFAKHLQEWVRHYPKGPWYEAAAIYKTTGHIEWGKCVQWIALAAMFLATLAALLELGLRRASAFALAALIALNPAVTSELTGFMVDGIMFSFLTVAIASLLSAMRSPRWAVLVACVTASIVTINAKFTGLVFLCIALAAAGVWCWFKHRAMAGRFAVAACATLVLGVCVWGYNPYVTNTIHVHQPLYPVLGSAQYPSIDHVERGETPRNMRGRNRFLRFGYAIFGRPGNQPYFIGKDATLMWPFMAHRADLYAYTYQETRVAGFGPWFSGCLLLSLALAAWLVAGRTPGRWGPLLICATIVASLLINRHLWWPRYGPQMWWLPIVPMVLALQLERPRRQRELAWAVLGVLLLNALIVAGVRMTWETTHTMALRRQLKEMRDSGKEYRVSTRYFTESAKVRLGEAGISYQDLGMKKLPNGHELVSVVEKYPDAIHYLAVDEMQ
jgi:hypothetical protein